MSKYLTLIFKPVYAQIFGNINPPPGVDRYAGAGGAGLLTLLNNIMKLLIAGAGIFAVFNLITAGYEFISANGEVDKVTKAWNKIWQSALGLIIAGGSFALAAIFGRIIFGSYDAILNPSIYGPN